MGTRFTRVTVVGDQRQVDVSLPADGPLASQVATVLRLLSVTPSPTPVRWRFATPEVGTLRPDRSLDDQGILDGTVLHLVEAEAAPPPPFVDDVERAVGEFVADRAPSWSGEARRSAVGGLVALVGVGLVVAGFVSPGAVAWIAGLVALALALWVTARLPGRGGLLAGLVAVPAVITVIYGVAATRPSLAPAGSSPLAIVGISTTWIGFRLVLGTAVALVVAAMGVARRTTGVVLAAVVLAVAGILALLADHAGMPAVRTAGLGLVLSVIVVALAGQAALGGAGLVNLMVADESGERVPRQRVADAVRRGLATSAGMVWAAAILGGLSALELVVGGTAVSGRVGQGDWVAPAFGALGGVLFALRSRMFSRAAHIAPMLAAALLTGLGIAVELPTWLGLTGKGGAGLTVAVLAVLALLVIATGLGQLSAVAGARIARLLDIVELLAVLALIPGVVLLFRVIPVVQAWWS